MKIIFFLEWPWKSHETTGHRRSSRNKLSSDLAQ
jgi:hypothetical protein